MALAIESVARLSPPAPRCLLGVAVAVTPAVLYFGAMVNPSGLTIAAALAAWTGASSSAGVERLDRVGWAAARVGLPLCVVVLMRRDSVLWGALLIAAVVALTPWERLRALLRVRAVWAWLVAVVASAALSLAVSGAETGSSLASQSPGGSFWHAVNDADFIARGVAGGILGWFDVALPFPVFPIYLVSTGFLVVAAVGFASRRVSLTLLAMTVAAIAVTVAIGTIRWPYVQGRYLLPLTVGLPIVAGYGLVQALGRVPLPRRLLWLLFPILVFAQVLSFAQALRRYVSGATEDWWFFSSPNGGPSPGTPRWWYSCTPAAVIALFGWWYVLAQGPRSERVDG